MRRVVGLGGALLAAVLVGLVALAAPAGAHVTVTAPGATQGASDQLITFRVPVEKPVATVGFRLQLPIATPIASVDVAPLPGWTHTEKSSTLPTPITTDDGQLTQAVTEVDWSATAGGLKPGEFGEFTILAGQLPRAASITFRAIQVYADGSQVGWTQVAAPGSGAEPEFPAPVLSLAPAASTSSASSSATARASAAPAKAASDTASKSLAIVAIALAAAALSIAVVTRARLRQGERSG
jgi:periplasmic copper chaperone A